jgi:hypothetical protein
MILGLFKDTFSTAWFIQDLKLPRMLRGTKYSLAISYVKMGLLSDVSEGVFVYPRTFHCIDYIESDVKVIMQMANSTGTGCKESWPIYYIIFVLGHRI